MKANVDSMLNHNTGPRKRQSAPFGMLRDHLVGVSKSAFGVAFYRPKRLMHSLHWSSELSSAAASLARRFSAKFSAK